MVPANFCLIMIHLLTSEQIFDSDASTVKRQKQEEDLTDFFS